MQLKARRSGRLRQTLGALSASLFAATAAHAQQPAFTPTPTDQGLDDRPDALSRVDTGVLFYQEAGGRVRAIEPATHVTLNGSDGRTLTAGLVSDTLTGASPNGALPSNTIQTFLTPLKATGSSTTVTSASGHSTVVQLPPTPGQVAASARQYTAAPNTLPVDAGFNDQRFAGNLGWSQPIGQTTKLNVGVGYSREHDYRAITGNLGLAKDFNARNTTLSLAVNLEADNSDPYGGVPTPLTAMSGAWKGAARNRTSTDVVLGLTQAMSRRWLLQFNYAYGQSHGYQNDPYRIISVVDGKTGAPVSYLYESRPGARSRQSVYLDNKLALPGNTLEVSGRYFWDNWGISSTTLDVADRVPIAGGVYLEPHLRWYRQSAADFFRSYLVSGQPLPQFASSDTRLGKFTGLTYGLTLGLNISENAEVYLRGERYNQSGDAHPAGAPGQLANQNLFAGVTANSLMVGFAFNF